MYVKCGGGETEADDLLKWRGIYLRGACVESNGERRTVNERVTRVGVHLYLR